MDDYSYRMDSKRAEMLFKTRPNRKNGKITKIGNITLPTNLPKGPAGKFRRPRAGRYSREASLHYNSTSLNDLKVNPNDPFENETKTENDTESDLPFNKVIVQTPTQKKDMSYIISNLQHYQDYRIEVCVLYNISLSIYNSGRGV
jgi:hypothetical protein